MAGLVDIDPAMPHAFLSYTRFDDNFLDGGISALRKSLEQAVRARTGEAFSIFQDVDEIKPGDVWREKLDEAIEAAQLFIPVLTPNFFTSAFCRRETRAFLDYEGRAGRGDLVLPVYLIETDRMDDEKLREADDIARQLHDRHYSDWRKLRFELKAEKTKPHIFHLAGVIASAVTRTNEIKKGPTLSIKAPEDELLDLRKEVESRDKTIAAERSRRKQTVAALSRERTRIRELAEATSAFEGQVEAAKKTEAVLRGEIVNLRQQLADTGSETVRQRLDEAEAALEEERAKGQQIERYASGIPRSLYLSAAALALLVGAAGWGVGQGGSSSEIELLRQQNSDLIERVEAQKTDLDDVKEALALAEESAANWEKAPSSGERFRDCDTCPQMVVVPSGSFMMGSPEGEGADDERPEHEVVISKSFALGENEVTFDEWDTCVEVGGCDHKPDDEGWGRGARPVINVSWGDAQQYVAWLSEKTGETYRLPSEAEWEYAVRAGTTTRYFWGESYYEGCRFANGADQTAKTEHPSWTVMPCDDGYYRTAPAGSFSANAFGLHDTSGNVWEWVQDSWHSSYEGAPADGSAWVVGKNSLRVIRGGAWSFDPWNLRSADRGRSEAGYRRYNIGFRVSKTLTP